MKKTVCKIDECTSCGACVNVCPKKCIKLVDDVEYVNAVIEKEACINCGACLSVCQVSQDEARSLLFSKTLDSYDCFSTLNFNEVGSSSSGGFATTLGIEFAKNGGFVVGIRNDGDSLCYDLINDPAEVKKFAGSKYVKVSTGDIYVRIKKLLVNGEKVLFVGTPCQVAGLKFFLRKDYSTLFTIDMVCHGTPSNKILNKYLFENGITSTKGLLFRKKHDFYLSINNKPISARRSLDPYSIGFLKGLYYTNNCYHCFYSRNERVSDLTIGDSWASLNVNSLGTLHLSLVLVQTDKGKLLFEMAQPYLKVAHSNYENAALHNHQLTHPSVRPDKQSLFFFEHYKKMTFKRIIRKIYPFDMFKQDVKNFLYKVHIKK